MAIDKDKPFTRENWNEDIIQRINDLAVNPDSGCDPVSTLEKVEPKHLWSKTDIQEAENKLKEICPDNEFPETPDLWSYSETILPLENAIDAGWCNCIEPEGLTYYDLGVWETQYLSARRSESSSSTKTICGTYTYTYSGAWYPEVSRSGTWAIINAHKAIINTQRTLYLGTAYEIFDLEDEIEKLENEIEILEGQIEGLKEDKETACVIPDSDDCIRITAELTEKENELTEKETELTEKETEKAAKIVIRDNARIAWDEAAQVQWTAWKSLELRYPTDVNPVRDLFPDLSEPWGDYLEDKRDQTEIGKWEYYYKLDDRQYKTKGRFSPGGYPYYNRGASQFWKLNLTCKHTTTTTTCDCNCYAWQINPTHCCCCIGTCVDPDPPEQCCDGISCDQTWDWTFGVPQVIWSSCIPSNDYYENCSHMIMYTLSLKVEHSPNYVR